MSIQAPSGPERATLTSSPLRNVIHTYALPLKVPSEGPPGARTGTDTEASGATRTSVWMPNVCPVAASRKRVPLLPAETTMARPGLSAHQRRERRLELGGAVVRAEVAAQAEVGDDGPAHQVGAIEDEARGVEDVGVEEAPRSASARDDQRRLRRGPA